jgi:hypothetical protein
MHFCLKPSLLPTKFRNKSLLPSSRLHELKLQPFQGVLDILPRLLAIHQLLAHLIVEALHILEVEHLPFEGGHSLVELKHGAFQAIVFDLLCAEVGCRAITFGGKNLDLLQQPFHLGIDFQCLLA